MKTLQSSMALVAIVLMMACGHSSKSSSYENNPIGDYSSSESEEGDCGEQEIQMVACSMFNGTGIFDFMPGDVWHRNRPVVFVIAMVCVT